MDHYINTAFSINALDIFIIKTSFTKAINNSFSEFQSNSLDNSFVKMLYKNHLFEQSNVKEFNRKDIVNAIVYDNNFNSDHTSDGITIPFENMIIECRTNTEMLEHFFGPESIPYELYGVLKTGAFYFTMTFLWNQHEVPHDAYKYKSFAIERLLIKFYFIDLTTLPTGAWHESMVQMLRLWGRRSAIQKYLCAILSTLLIRLNLSF